MSISGISQLLQTRFWPNFEGRFLEQSTNSHSDICNFYQKKFAPKKFGPTKISPKKICRRNKIVAKKICQKDILAKKYFAKKFHEKENFCQKIVLKKIICPKNAFKIFFWINKCLPKMIFFCKKNLLEKILTNFFFVPNIFFLQRKFSEINFMR